MGCSSWLVESQQFSTGLHGIDNHCRNLFYEFTINGDEVFCREGYVNAEALLAHLENVGAMLEQALAMADHAGKG